MRFSFYTCDWGVTCESSRHLGENASKLKMLKVGPFAAISDSMSKLWYKLVLCWTVKGKYIIKYR